jgi:hypothetical protein
MTQGAVFNLDTQVLEFPHTPSEKSTGAISDRVSGWPTVEE